MLPLKPKEPDFRNVNTKIEAKLINKLRQIYQVNHTYVVTVNGIRDLVAIIEASGNLHPAVIADRLKAISQDKKVA